MKLVDLLGNALEVGDLVSVKSDHLVGQIVKIEDGTIAKGLSISGQPKGELTPAHMIVKIEMSSLVAALPSGQCPSVLKIAKPAPQEEKSLLQ